MHDTCRRSILPNLFWCEFGVLILAALVFVGCKPSTPPIVPVSGTVTVDGKPLPHAKVWFTPTVPGVNGDFMASAVTDEEGKYVLVSANGESGVCSCQCKVTVSEGPIPEELRAKGQAGGPQIAKFRKSLKNRPIPRRYMTLGQSPLVLEISEETSDYPLELSR